MSGIIKTLFSLKILSAFKVVGELAPSTITCAFMFDALVDVITPPTADGINTSHSSSVYYTHLTLPTTPNV